MTATNHDGHNHDGHNHDGHNHDGHKPWWPQTMTATNVFSADGMTMNSPWIWRFLQSMPLVFYVFIAVAIMVYLVAIMVCGRHGCGHHGIGPN